MGNGVLKTHATAAGQFSPDGWYGIVEGEDDNRLVLPVEDGAFIDRVCEEFQLGRGKAPGLSIIVPWYQESEITVERVIEAVIRDYFYPILIGALKVTVVTPKNTVDLESSSLLAVLETLGPDLQREMSSLVNLARWAITPRDGLHSTSSPQGPPRWSQDLLTENAAAELRAVFNRGEPVAIRVPLTVRPKGGAGQDSHFDVFLRRDEESSGDRPVFIREGIIIPDVRAPRTHDVRALVVAEHGPLARLLGDAENPAHTQWQRDGSNFKGKYVYGPQYLGFVTNAANELVKMLSDVDAPEDRSLLLDIFSLPAPPEDEDELPRARVQPTPKPKPDVPPPPPAPPRKPRPFRVVRIQGGFTVTRGDADAPVPKALDIRVAYDRRNGNPLKKYDRADFRLDKNPIKLDAPRGLHVRKCDSNHLLVALSDPDFSLSVRGFDENRDLYVRVIAKEALDDQEA
jgi:hypothetical protein